MQDPDVDDMQSVKAGEIERFTRLVTRHQSRLFRYAVSRLNSRDLAEDAVQETLLAIYRGRETFNAERGFRGWLWTVHSHVCDRLAQQRARWKRNCQVAGAFQRTEQVDSPPGRAIEEEDARELVAVYLERLPDEQAEAIRLRFFGELSFDEMAEATGHNPATMKSRVRYGLGKLNQWLESLQETLQ